MTQAIPDSGPPVTASGRVVHIEPHDTDEFEVAIRLTDIGAEARHRLSNYIKKTTDQRSVPTRLVTS